MARTINQVKSPQWWKHLRDWKKVFWKKHRQQSKKELDKWNRNSAL
jgi:hypothetical protein